MSTERLSYPEWMKKIKSNYQAPCYIEKGIEHLTKELDYKIPEGVIKNN